MIAIALRIVLLALLLGCQLRGASAHDPSTYGGLFRSRNLGETWLNADAGLFVNAALAVAADPRDPNHLLLGTDAGLLASRNGGRTWSPQAPGLILGAAFAIAFAPEGEQAICVAPSGVFYFGGGEWRRSAAPDGAVPAHAAVFGPGGRAYLLGAGGLFLSEDGGQSFRSRLRLDASAALAALVLTAAPDHSLFFTANGTLMASLDGGNAWQPRRVNAEHAVDTVAGDPASPARLWAGSVDRLFLSEDAGASWRQFGQPLPEPQTNIRGIAADASLTTLVVTTHRGMYRSTDHGATWTLKEGSLPIHLEAGRLLRDPEAPQTLYAVYSLMPYPEVWRAALKGGNLLSRMDTFSLAGGLAFVLLLAIGAGLLVRWLQRLRLARPSVRGSLP